MQATIRLTLAIALIATLALAGRASVAFADLPADPPLTPAQLDALKQVRSWTVVVEQRQNEFGADSGTDTYAVGNYGHLDISSWTALHGHHYKADVTYTVVPRSGYPGCAGTAVQRSGGTGEHQQGRISARPAGSYLSSPLPIGPIPITDAK